MEEERELKKQKGNRMNLLFILLILQVLLEEERELKKQKEIRMNLIIMLLILQVLLKEERELKKLMQKEKKRAQAEEAAKTAAKE